MKKSLLYASMINRRVAAFTLMELTVAMLISGIVIAISYTSYVIISQSYFSYQVRHSEMFMVLRLDELLKKDFNKAELIFQEPNNIEMITKQGPVSYRFEENQIIRIANITDTFKVMTTDLHLAYEQQTITIDARTDAITLIDELSFNFLLKKEQFPCHYQKLYSSENLINQHPHAQY